MKNVTLLVIILALAILAAGCAGQASNQASGTSNKPTVAYDKNGITFNYPANWEVISPNSLNIQVTDFKYLAVLSNNDTDGRSIVEMVIAETGQSYDDFVTSEKAYDQKSSGFAESSTTVDGVPAVEYTTGGSSDQRKSVNIYFEKGGKTYYLALADDTKNFDQDKADFDTMLNSLHVE